MIAVVFWIGVFGALGCFYGLNGLGAAFALLGMFTVWYAVFIVK